MKVIIVKEVISCDVSPVAMFNLAFEDEAFMTEHSKDGVFLSKM